MDSPGRIIAEAAGLITYLSNKGKSLFRFALIGKVLSPWFEGNVSGLERMGMDWGSSTGLKRLRKEEAGANCNRVIITVMYLAFSQWQKSNA